MLELTIVDGKIPLEEKCPTDTCINGIRRYGAGGTKEDPCPHCNGTTKVLHKNGEIILELIKKYSK